MRSDTGDASWEEWATSAWECQGSPSPPPTKGGGLKRVEPSAYFSLLHLLTGLGGQVGLTIYL